MANLSFQAAGKTGHVSINTLSARGAAVYNLLNCSYNYVSIKPALILVQNSTNDGAVEMIDNMGNRRVIPAHTNYKLAIAGFTKLSLRNNGRVDCTVLIFDASGESQSDVNLTPSQITTGASLNDFLFHFEEAAIANLVNSGAEAAWSLVATAGFTPTTTNVKFGVRAVSCVGGLQTIEFTDNSFFDMTKDFTVDFWFNWLATDLTTPKYIWWLRTAAVAPEISLSLSLTAVGLAKLRLVIDGTVYTSANVVVTDAGGYQFIRLIKSGNNWSAYVGGVLAVSASQASTTVCHRMGIGDVIAGNLSASFDELRFAKGYVESDTSVPRAPYY